MNIAILDFGNTRVKIKISKDIFVLTYMNNWKLKLEKIILKNKIKFIYYSSVNLLKTEELKKFFLDKEIVFFDTSTLIQEQEKKSIINFSNVIGMGADRKFGLIAALDFSQPPLITIDCGTAITINLLDYEHIALGGVIMPGILTQAKSLKYFTNKLPFVDIEIGDFVFGKNTQEAINTGVNATVLGGITYIYEKIKKSVFANKKINIIFTGGYGELVMEALDLENSQYVNDLVLLGVEKFINKI